MKLANQSPVSIFIGPSLPPAMRPTDPNLRFFPPACAGDMLALADSTPHAVLLIDGLFERERAPWHKEVLVLLSNGFDVWGAASIGALRAAELGVFGMRSSGAIARAYCDGRIVGDDEVAVAHAPAALGHRALTLAQVDVRATLVAAVRQHILSMEEARKLRSASRDIFFKERNWASVLAAARISLAPARHARLADWLPGGAVSLKQIDSLRAIAEISAGTRLLVPSAAPPETVFLRRLRDHISSASRRDNSLQAEASLGIGGMASEI